MTVEKPHRIALLSPTLTLDEADAAVAAEARLLVAVTCADTLAHHPRLAVLDLDGPLDGPTDPARHFKRDRRDELLRLELPLAAGGSAMARLHVERSDGGRRSFEAFSPTVEGQLNALFTSWLNDLGFALLPSPLPPLPRAELLVTARALGGALADGASALACLDAATAALPPALRCAALRSIAHAQGHDVAAAIAAIDPDHPSLPRPAPGAPIGLLAPLLAWVHDEDGEAEHAPTPFEDAAAAAMALVLAPGSSEIAVTVAERLHRSELPEAIDRAIRVAERGVALDPDQASAHLALLGLYASAERIGAWLHQSHASSSQHGCPMDSPHPWYPDQIQIDLAVATSLMNAGRLDEAIALRENRLEGREESWPRHARILDRWRKDPRFVAWSYGREGFFRGEDGRVVEGFGRIEPDDGVDLGMFLDGLVAVGREAEVPLAWAHLGRGRRLATPFARLAAGRALAAAGRFRAGIEELWDVQLRSPSRDAVAVAHALRLYAAAPLEELEAAVSERLASGAVTLARRFARDLADFVPGAAESEVIRVALDGGEERPFHDEWLAGWSEATPGRAAIDALLSAATGGDDAQARADALVNRWPEALFVPPGAAGDRTAAAQATAYAAAQALARYLAATTSPPSVVAGALRTVAAEAIAALAPLAGALPNRDLAALLATLEPIAAAADPRLVEEWLAHLERSLRLDERTDGRLAALAAKFPAIAAHLVGPEDLALASWSAARRMRARDDGWAEASASLLARVCWLTGGAGAGEWATAVAASSGDLDALLSACYLAQGRDRTACLVAAPLLFQANEGEVAFATLCDGLAALPDGWKDPRVKALADDWEAADLEVPFAFNTAASGLFEALQKGDPARAERLGRWVIALDGGNGEAHRNFGLALAMQGKTDEALEHLVRATPEQATQILAGVLYQTGRMPFALEVLDYACRWYVRAEPWLTYGGIAFAAGDSARAARGYGLAHQLDPDPFDPSMLNAFAGVLDDVGDYAACERVAARLLSVAGDDPTWLSNAWHHHACAYLGQGRFDEAVAAAERAAELNPLPDNAATFAATLEKARSRTRSVPPAAAPLGPPREPAFLLVERGDVPAASSLAGDPSWRVRRAALRASRCRFGSESRTPVTPRALAAAARVLDESAGLTDGEASLCRALALEVRAQASFPRDPQPWLGDRMTREAFYAEFRARGGVVLGEAPPEHEAFVDREVIPGARVASAAGYVALLRDLAALRPAEALARHGLDDAGYRTLATAWTAALDGDAALASLIEAGLAAGGGAGHKTLGSGVE